VTLPDLFDRLQAVHQAGSFLKNCNRKMAGGLEKHDLLGRIIILRNEMIIPKNIVPFGLIFSDVGNNHPKRRTHIFQRGRYTTSQME
jgi:hypothetical protein